MNPTKLKFRDIAKNHGVIYTQVYKTSRDGVKELSFAPIEPIPNQMRCGQCGRSEWNATNFHNPVHFCPDRELEVFVSEFSIHKRNP